MKSETKLKKIKERKCGFLNMDCIERRMRMNYYVIRQYSESGVRKTPANYPYQTRPEAERQFNLLCAAAWKNEMDVALDTMTIDFESVEIGTVEHGMIDRKYFNHVKPQPEPEPEPEELEEVSEE